MNAFLDLTCKRYSVRNYSEKQIEKEKLDKVLEAGNNAPTAKNSQPQRIFVIQSEQAKARIRRVTQFHYDAPCFLLICYNEDESWFGPNNRLGAVDAAIVGTHMILEAAELGLGTVWVASFNHGMAREEFGFPDNLVPVAILPIGYPADGAQPGLKHAVRKNIAETVSYL